MAAGKIKIYKIVTEQIGARIEERDPVLFYSPWCDISDLYGEELYSALNAKLKETVQFKVRYCAKVKEIRLHLKDYFVEYEGSRYEVYATDFLRNEKQYVFLKCNRIS